MIETIQQFLATNQVASGFGMAAIMGGVMYQLRQVPQWLSVAFRYHLTVGMTVRSGSHAFGWIEQLMASQKYSARSRSLIIASGSHGMWASNIGIQDSKWALTSGYGSHVIWWKRRPIWVQRATMNNVGSNSGPVDVISMRVLGRSQWVLREIVQYAHEQILAELRSDLTAVQMWHNKRWTELGMRKPRQLSTLFLASGQSESIIADIQQFKDNEAWYRDRGIPYRRGYIFAGPPGTGKTSLVSALAGHFKMPIAILNLATITGDDQLFDAISTAPGNSIILMEDIDCATDSVADRKTESDTPTMSMISKAGLLNVLDGIVTPEGQIFIMTTNFPERLDAALTRPGRADVTLTLGKADVEQQTRMAAAYYGTGVFDPVDAQFSPAVLQGVFMRNIETPDLARQELIEVSLLETTMRAILTPKPQNRAETVESFG